MDNKHEKDKHPRKSVPPINIERLTRVFVPTLCTFRFTLY